MDEMNDFTRKLQVLSNQELERKSAAFDPLQYVRLTMMYNKLFDDESTMWFLR
jgi:hypothetical protein